VVYTYAPGGNTRTPRRRSAATAGSFSATDTVPGAIGIPVLGEGRVYAVEPLGSDQLVNVSYGSSDDAEFIKVRTRPDARFRVGDAISLSASPSDIYLFNEIGDRMFPDDARA
jgi:ABC-type sugar transport system ATPase subunit